MSSIQQLRNDLIRFVTERTEAVVSRFLPNFEIPGFMAGYRTAGFDTADLIYLAANLQSVGVSSICGVPVESIFRKLLKKVDGPKTETFYSYRIAETILGLGGFPALNDFSESELQNLREAIDSTHIYIPETGQLTMVAQNYWAVLARCEFARQRLGVLEDTFFLDLSLAKTREILSENPLGYFDDSPEGVGRYDSYSADMYLFTEPFWHLIGPEIIETNLVRHIRFVEQIALENGASVAWGRSIGALSVCLTMEIACLSLHKGVASDPARSLALARNAFEKFKDWIRDDLIAAHRDGMTENYRGVYRLLQMTLDCLSKLCAAANSLTHAPEVEGECSCLFPEIDTFLPFDNRHAGLWMVRNKHLAFQLPIVSGSSADYAAWLHSPGLFENPVERPMPCGLPRVGWQRAEFFPAGLPSTVEKFDAGLRARFDRFIRSGGDETAPEFKGVRTVSYQVEGDTIIGREQWKFEELPDAICFHIPESKQALHLTIETEAAHHYSIVAIEGMAEWRSAWGRLRRLHQVDFRPAKEIEFTWRLRPTVKVTVAPASNDYIRDV